MLDLMINLMIAQILMGAFDTLYHHEIKVALPQTPGAALELSIHAIRALLYSIVFMGLAWYQWGGVWVWVLVSIVLIEVVLTLWDFVIEDTTRLLPKSERITHTLLAINGGAVFVLLATELPQWLALSSAFYDVHYGWRSWFLTVGAIGVGVSGVRDAFSAWTVQRLDLKLQLDLGTHRRLLVSGGTGFIGSALIRELLHQSHDVTVVSRHPVAAAIQFQGKVRAVRHVSELDSSEHFDVIINLAGAPVVGLPWSQQRKKIITDSRLDSTRDLMAYAKSCQQKPQVWIQASAIGYYGTDSRQIHDEASPSGDGFAADLCCQWEALARELDDLSIRRVTLRFGLVFGRSGGSLPMMLLSYKMGMGTVIGHGRQYMGWIHIEDLLRLIALSVRDESMQGDYNAVTPDSPTYHQFAQLAAHMLHRPVWFSIPEVLLRKLLGEMASMFVDGPRIMPCRLEQTKFEYRFPDLRSALMDLT